MTLNFTLISIAIIVQFILGAVWYGPLFGKTWMRIMGGDKCTPKEIKAMQKAMGPFYLIQIVLTAISTIILSIFIDISLEYSVPMTAFILWLGFIVPTQISGVIWGSTKKEFWLKQILILAGCQFVSIMLAAWILSM